jgi:enterochelin esterase family protein
VEIPGTTPRYDELRDVPHGAIVLRTYASKLQGRQRSLRVYLPPQYHTEPNRKFPVLYLFNGQDEAGWTTDGKVNVVLDNLLADKKAVPMVIVMPNNTIHGENIQQRAPYAAKATTPEGRAGLASSAETVATLEKELPGEIMPMIETEYRVLTDRKNRAIAGLSFGGGTAFGVGMRHLDLFNFVGEFGTGTFGGLANPPGGYVSYLIPYDAEKIAPGIHKNLLAPATRLKLFYMSCGEQDPRFASQKLAYEDFKQRGIDVVFMPFPGAHEFKFFRRAMADYVSRLFK